MDFIIGFLVLVALGTAIWIVQSIIEKGIGVATKAANQNILYRSEHKEGQEIVTQSVTFQTSASISKMMDLLSENVIIAENFSGVAPAVYETSRSDDMITYAFGNFIEPKKFEAVVALTNNDGITEGLFSILNWFETNGLIREQSAMKKLRNQVQSAFEAAEGLVNNNETNQEVKIQKHCSKCGTEKKETAKFCPECGLIFNVAENVNDNVCIVTESEVMTQEVNSSAIPVEKSSINQKLETGKDLPNSQNWDVNELLNKGQAVFKNISSQAQGAFKTMELNVKNNGKTVNLIAKYCPKCGSSFSTLAKFCPECGSIVGTFKMNEASAVAAVESGLSSRKLGNDTIGNESKSINSEDISGDKNFKNLKFKKNTFGVIGAVLSLTAIIKMRFIGYYRSEWPLYFGILILGVICFYIYSKIKIEE